MSRLGRKIGVLISILILLLIIFTIGCSRPSRSNDRFLSRVPSELKEHYKFIDRYRGMYPDKLDSIVKLFDDRYDTDSSSIESAYYNLAFAYRECSQENYEETLSLLLRVENALEGRDFPALEAELNLLKGVVYRSLALNQFSKEKFKDAYSYFKEGDYPNQTLLSALNLAWLESSDSLEDSQSSIDSYIDLSDSIFINNHDRVRYANYYHYKYLVNQSNWNYLDSILTVIDIAEEPSIDIDRLYNMNINLLMALNFNNKFAKARVVSDRMDSIYRYIGENRRPRSRNLHLFEKSIILAKEGHHKCALDVYEDGVRLRNLRSDIRVDINRYRALYRIYYTVGDMAKSDSAWVNYHKACDRLAAKQDYDGVSVLLEYRDFAEKRNENILNQNRINMYIQLILAVIGVILIGYIISTYRTAREIKRKDSLKSKPDDEYIKELEDQIEEFDKRIMILEQDIELERILEELE